MTDKIMLKIINPIGKEAWTELYEISKAVEIYINNTELINILYELEKPYATSEGNPSLAGRYGHLTPKEFFDNLTKAKTPDEYHKEYGTEILCCDGCGDSGCWSICVFIKYDDDYVYWYKFRHNHRDWKYDISYKFDKTEYEKTLEALKNHI
ncbi:MAG: hypothetical protein UE295_02615 [Acutalibacteraceae bacterium]|nr:hypothetical protein [Acutalibacteraceae bacterium]